jgi:hypothetical protein
VHGFERDDVMFPLLSSERQEIMLKMAGGNTNKFTLLRNYFNRIDSGRIVEDLPRPGYEIEKLEPEIVSKFLRHILPVLQQRPEVVSCSAIIHYLGVYVFHSTVFVA